MKKLRRPTLWLAVVIAAGVFLMPQRGAADPYKWLIPEEQPRLGDPDDSSGGRSQKVDWINAGIFTVRIWTGQTFVIDLSRLSWIRLQAAGER